MSHYYSFDASLKSKPILLDVYFKDTKLTFKSDIGVFSKNEVDFGSFTLIKTLLDYPLANDLLDVGCGYGVIGLSLAFFKKCNYLEMIDINERAVKLSIENQKRLSILNANIYQSDGFIKVTHLFDRIVMNPPIRAGKKVIYQMFEDAFLHLKVNGDLWIVIKKDLGALSAQKKLLEVFNNCELVNKKKGYWILKATKLENN